MKVVCAWCKKVIRESPEEIVSHGICEKCEKRMVRDIVDPPPEEFSGWFTFMERQVFSAFVCFALIFLGILAVEGLHYLTGGKVSQLIEWQPRNFLSTRRKSLKGKWRHGGLPDFGLICSRRNLTCWDVRSYLAFFVPLRHLCSRRFLCPAPPRFQRPGDGGDAFLARL